MIQIKLFLCPTNKPKLLMRNPRNFFHFVKFHRPATRHIEEIAQTIQIALHSRIHFIALYQRHHRTLGTTANRAAHLQRRSTRGWWLRVIQNASWNRNGERLERRKLGIQFVDPLLESGDVVFGEFRFFDFVGTIAVNKAKRDKYELRLGGVAMAAPKSNNRLWICW